MVVCAHSIWTSKKSETKKAIHISLAIKSSQERDGSNVGQRIAESFAIV